MEHRWILPTDHLVKKRERAVFLGNRLKVSIVANANHKQKKQTVNCADFSNYKKNLLMRVNFCYQEFSEMYHSEKTRAAAAMEEKKPKAIPMEVKLARSVSVQEELQTPN